MRSASDALTVSIKRNLQALWNEEIEIIMHMLLAMKGLR
jgi:hypothetical protein